MTGAVRILALNTISAFRNGVSLKWNDAELGIYLVFLFGEINKCELFLASLITLFVLIRGIAGGKGRAAFCQAPHVEKGSRKVTDYSEYPFTPHGEMLFTLVQSGIASFPNRTVSLQFFETVARYTDFFKVRKECIIPALEPMIDTRLVSCCFLLFGFANYGPVVYITITLNTDHGYFICSIDSSRN